MKEIRIFSNLNKLQLSQEVNDFICNNINIKYIIKLNM